jgi:hypothetical protein
MTILAELVQVLGSRMGANTRRMWSEVARTHAIAACNAARIKLLTVANDCCPTTFFAQKAEYDNEDKRAVVAREIPL